MWKNNSNSLARRLIWALALGLLIYSLLYASTAHAKKPSPRSKFYNFDEQMIDGQVRKPTYLYINTRDKAKFERLLSLKKSFMQKLFETSKRPVFK
jgi:hypothetical protein